MYLKNKKYILTVTLNPCLDHFVFLDGKTKAFWSAAGKGINVSRGLEGLDCPSLATGLIGGESGVELKRCLDKENIANDFLKVKAITRINETRIDSRKGMERKIEAGKNPGKKSLIEFVQKYKKLLKKASLVIISGRNAYNASPKIYYELIYLAKKFDLPVLVDTSFQSLVWSLKARPTVVKLNEEEFCQLFDIKKVDLKELKNYFNWFKKRGVKKVLLSLASRGAVGFNESGCFKVTAPKVFKAFEVGCGDAMLAGFAAESLKGSSFEESLLVATACGTDNARCLIPGKINKKSIKQILKRCKLKKIFYSAECSY